MKRLKRALCVLSILAALASPAAIHATNYKVIVVSGQSNSGDWSYWGEGPFPDAVKTWINDPSCDALILWFLANEANTGAQARAGTFTISSAGQPSQNITVIQPGTDPFLAAMPNRFVLKATPNTNGTTRTAHVTVTSGSAPPVIVPITQNAAGRFLAFDPITWRLGSGANHTTTVLVDADSVNSTGSSRQAEVVLTSTSGATVTNIVTQPSAGTSASVLEVLRHE
jgi:hypothetical protein